MSVCLPLSLTSDWTLFASSGRTKFEEIVVLTTRSPASMAAGSSVAQYFPSRYSSTKTGTFAPTFTLRTRSLRTTLPAKTDAAFWSSSAWLTFRVRLVTSILSQASQFSTAGRIEQADAHRLLPDLLDVDHHGHGVRLDLLGVVADDLSCTSPVASSKP